MYIDEQAAKVELGKIFWMKLVFFLLFLYFYIYFLSDMICKLTEFLDTNFRKIISFLVSEKWIPLFGLSSSKFKIQA